MIEIDHNIPHLSQKLGKLVSALGQVPLDAIGATLADSTRTRIIQGTIAPDGTPWEKLKPATIHAKGRDDILIHNSHLHKTIKYLVQGNTLEVGSPLTYSKYHQVGTKHIPARPFLGLSDDDKRTIDERIKQWLLML